MRKSLFNAVLISLIILEIIFIYLWIERKDGSWEPLFTLINGLLMPFILYLKVKKSETLPLEFFIEKCEIKSRDQIGIYFFQTSFKIKSNELPITIDKIILKTKYTWGLEKTPYSNTGLLIECLFPFQEEDYLKLSQIEIYKEIKTLSPTCINPRGLEITPNSIRHFSLLGELNSERASDGWEDFNLDDWILKIFYNGNQEIEIEIKWTIHKNSEKIPIKFKYTGFESNQKKDKQLIN
jgi:hypothetical protein